MTAPTPSPTDLDGILAAHGFAVPTEDRDTLVGMITVMRTAASALYDVPEARYVDPAITWSAVSD